MGVKQLWSKSKQDFFSKQLNLTIAMSTHVNFSLLRNSCAYSELWWWWWCLIVGHLRWFLLRFVAHDAASALSKEIITVVIRLTHINFNTYTEWGRWWWWGLVGHLRWFLGFVGAATALLNGEFTVLLPSALLAIRDDTYPQLWWWWRLVVRCDWGMAPFLE